MEIAKYVLCLLLVVVSTLNVLATVSIIKAASLTAAQKVGQTIFVWLVPFVGAKLVLHLLSESEPEAVKWIRSTGLGALIIAGTYHDTLFEQDRKMTLDDSESDSMDGTDGH